MVVVEPEVELEVEPEVDSEVELEAELELELEVELEVVKSVVVVDVDELVFPLAWPRIGKYKGAHPWGRAAKGKRSATHCC